MDLFFVLCPASKKLYYVHVREWQYHAKGKKQSKSWQGDREGMVKMIKQARAWAAQKAAAKPGAKKVKQNPNRSKGKSRKIWWQQRARSGMASSSRPTGTQYATVPHDPCPIQYLGDYMRSPFFVVSFFVTSPLWYLPPEAYARRRPGGGFRVPAAFSRASVPAAFTQGSGPEAVAGPSRNLMPNVGNWHGVVPIQQPQQPPSINVQVINVNVGQGAAADGQLASLLQAPWHKQGRRLLVSFLSDFVM